MKQKYDNKGVTITVTCDKDDRTELSDPSCIKLIAIIRAVSALVVLLDLRWPCKQ
jgi:hypothetical protein